MNSADAGSVLAFNDPCLAFFPPQINTVRMLIWLTFSLLTRLNEMIFASVFTV